MKVFFIAIIGAYIAGNTYVFIRTMQMMQSCGVWWRMLVGVAFWTVAFSMIISMFLRGVELPIAVQKAMFNIGAVWMVFTLYMVLALMAVDIAKIFIPTMRGGYLYALGVTTLLLAYGYYNYRHPKIVNLEIAIDKPITGGNTRVVAVSDIHLGNGTDKRALQRYVEMINSQQPDAIIIGGDLIDNSLTPVRQQRMEEELRKLQAPQGIYMVAGNHEYISRIDECEKFLQHTPIQLLRDSVVTLTNGIQIVGRDDRSNRDRLSLSQLLCNTDAAKPIIVIDHQPYNIAEANAAGIDLQFSGHTHRGQVWPLNLLTDYIYEQSHGYRKWSKAHIYVSSGLSLWGPPFRIGTNSDMVVFDIKSTAKE
ncbi:MAG: metallophosphoesterase [Alistipes sp.]|nr:metallophosphoesterase [Alistipes sp.]